MRRSSCLYDVMFRRFLVRGNISSANYALFNFKVVIKIIKKKKKKKTTVVGGVDKHNGIDFPLMHVDTFQ